MIDEIDYFPKRERHNKKKKVDSGWSDLKKQKNKQGEKFSPPLEEKDSTKNKEKQQKLIGNVYNLNIQRSIYQSFQELICHEFQFCF